MLGRHQKQYVYADELGLEHILMTNIIAFAPGKNPQVEKLIIYGKVQDNEFIRFPHAETYIGMNIQEYLKIVQSKKLHEALPQIEREDLGKWMAK